MNQDQNPTPETTPAVAPVSPTGGQLPVAVPTTEIQPEISPTPEKPKSKRKIFMIIGAVLVLLALGMTLYVFVLSPYRISAKDSNLLLTDSSQVWIEKLSYRFGQPKVGDVVLFVGPGSAEQTKQDWVGVVVDKKDNNQYLVVTGSEGDAWEIDAKDIHGKAISPSFDIDVENLKQKIVSTYDSDNKLVDNRQSEAEIENGEDVQQNLQNFEPPSNWLAFSNSDYGFEVNHPDTWSVTREEAETDTSAIFVFSDPAEPNSYIAISVVGSEIPDKPTFEEWSEFNSTLFKNGDSVESVTLIDGVNAQTITNGGTTVLFFANSDKTVFYFINYSEPNSNSVASQILSTFEFTD